MFERLKQKLKQTEAHNIFYSLFCENSYVLDLKSNTYLNLNNLNDMGAFKNLIDSYRENCHCKNFDRESIDKYFSNIINNTGIVLNFDDKAYSIEFSQLEGTLPVVSQLVYVPKNESTAYLLEMRKPAKIDEFTRLYNKAEFKNDIAKLSKQSKIDSQLTIISFDVNGLKRINDEHQSHAIGDELIKAVARCIYDAFNSFGKCYRNGKGDEFAVIAFLPAASLSKQLGYFDELLKNAKVPEVDEISISYGVATKSELPNKSIEELYNISDERLYENKRMYYERKALEKKKKLNI